MMIATAEYPLHRFANVNISGNEWIDDHRIRVPWLNFLTSQSIPEETDVSESFKQKFSDDDCSLSSMEDFYIVLDIPKPQLTEKPMVEMKFAEINQDVEDEQLVLSMIDEIPLKEHAIEQLVELNGKGVQVSSIVLHYEARKTNDQRSNIEVMGVNHGTNEYQSVPKSSPLSEESFACVNSMEYNSMSPRKSNLSRIHPEKEILTRAFVLDRASPEKHREIPKSTTQQKLKSTVDCSKTSALRRLMQRPARVINDSSNKTNEPSLIRISYLDGRRSLTNVHDDCSPPTKISFAQNPSYRQRLFNHLQRLIKPITTEQSKRRATFEPKKIV